MNCVDPGFALCFVAASLLAIVALIVLAISAGHARQAVFGVLVFGLLLCVIALSGCASCPPPPRVAPTCVLDEPPPLLGDIDGATDEELQAVVRWSVRTWLACADMRASSYPSWNPEEPADDGEDLEE